jgi:exonuclease SbcC
VKLLSLYASNFKKLKFEVPTEFKEGLTLISGLNEAGKSSILDAILFALFARVTRPPGKTRNEDIIAYNTNEATVRLDLEVESRRYRVTRQIYRTKASKARLDEVLPDNQLKPVAVEVKRVTEEIEKILGGITFDEIVSSNVVAQKDLNRLVQLRSDARKKVINVFLNLDSFNVVLEELNDERKELEGTGISRPGLVNIEKQRLDALREELEESRRRGVEIDKLEDENKRKAEALIDLGKEYGRLKLLQEQLTEYDESMRKKNDLETKLEFSQKELKTFEDNVSFLDNQISANSKNLENYAELSAIETSLDQVKGKIDSIRQHEAEIRDAQQRQKDLSGEVSLLKTELGDFDYQKLQKLRQSKNRVRPFAVGTAAAFGLAFVAFLIGFLIPAVALAVLGALSLAFLIREISGTTKLAVMERLAKRSDLLESKNKDLQIASASLDLAKSQKSSIENDLLVACTSISRYGSILETAKQQRAVSVAEAMMGQVQSERREADKLTQSVQALKNQLDQTIKRFDLSTHTQRVKELNDQLVNVVLPPLPPSIVFSDQLLRDTFQEKEMVARNISKSTEAIDSNKRRIDEDRKYLEDHADIESKVGDQEKKVQELEHKIRVVKSAIDATEKTSESLSNRVKPGVERYMAHVLPAITSGRYKAVRLDQDYNLEVWDPEAGEFMSKDVFSGGTEDQMLLALRLSFAQALLPEVYGRKPEFLFLDEPLGSSDEVRRTGILEFLETGLRNSFKQIFLISHVGGLEQEIPNIIKLEDGKVVNISPSGYL